MNSFFIVGTMTLLPKFKIDIQLFVQTLQHLLLVLLLLYLLLHTVKCLYIPADNQIICLIIKYILINLSFSRSLINY